MPLHSSKDLEKSLSVISPSCCNVNSPSVVLKGDASILAEQAYHLPAALAAEIDVVDRWDTTNSAVHTALIEWPS